MKSKIFRNIGLGILSVLFVSGMVYGFSGWEGVENATNGDSLTHTVWNSFVNGVVKKTGSVAETITGVKTFSSAPIVPTPTADTEAANKQYVDDNNSSGFSANISSQSIPSAVTTKLQFDTEHYDINNEYDNSINYRFTPTISGKYLVTLFVELDNLTGGKYMQGRITRNGSMITRNHVSVPSTVDASVSASVILDMNGSSDYVEAHIYHTNGSNRSINGANSRFTAQLLHRN